MNCRRVRRLLASFVAEELSTPRSALLRGHLRDCHPCARAFAGEREARNAFRETLRSPDPPSNLWDRIESRLLSEAGAPRPFLDRLARRLTPRSAAAAGLFLAAALGGSFLLLRPGGDGLGPPSAGSGEPGGLVRTEGSAGDEEYSGFLRRLDGDAREFFTFPVGDTVPVSGPGTGRGGSGMPRPLNGQPAGLRPVRRDF
ncbi:MAG TPA: zf-HC2 domain-containing protein [Planctomycetota bacterium]|jgi:hypothetical protein|nr:zf-HC2 domain-containing protein [Planctomycetota bacterium]